MTTPKLLLIGASESTKSLIEWVTSGHFTLMKECTFPSGCLGKLEGVGLVVFATPPTTAMLADLQNQQIPALLLLHADDLSAHAPLFVKDGVDYLIQPFHPQDLLFRLKKNMLPPGPSVSVALFDPSGLISQEMLAKWQHLGMSVHLFVQDKPLMSFIKNEVPDVVISDAAIPPHNAETLIDVVKSRQIPLFGLFSEQMYQIESNSIYAQADDYSVAPFEGDALLLRLKRILKKQQPATPKVKKQLKNSALPEGPVQNGDTPALMRQVNVTLNHEIRSPLTSILIGAQVIQKGATADSQEYQIAREIEDASRRIQTTLDDFGQVKQVVVDDYINGIKMLNLKRSRQTSGAQS